MPPWRCWRCAGNGGGHALQDRVDKVRGHVVIPPYCGSLGVFTENALPMMGRRMGSAQAVNSSAILGAKAAFALRSLSPDDTPLPPHNTRAARAQTRAPPRPR